MTALRRWSLCVLFGVATVVSAGPPRLVNQVADHPSPYLAMHGADPVHWQSWSRDTVELAKRLNRPMLVSIGYFACHWCHVMQRESYQDPLLADLLNRHFIPVKVDRELNPALDAHLIEFVELTRGQAGWPLNVLLTPDGYPLVGVVYLPRDQFYLMLSQFARRWPDEQARITAAAREAMQEWRGIRAQRGSRPATTGVAAEKQLLEQASRLGDELAGGFGEQTKFPLVPQLQALMTLAQRRQDIELEAFVNTTLAQMAGQGLHDNLGGGFFRYVIDPGWQVPHYEKMLYDNAQLAVLYFQAAEVYASEASLQIARSTMDFLMARMRQADQAFIGSLSAVDSEGREGYYYQWSDEQLAALLDDNELRAVKAAWFGVRAVESEYGRLPRWQANISELAGRLEVSPQVLAETLDAARAKLLKARAARDLPADTKVLAAWNGLALTALATAFEATGNTGYRRQANRLADYLSTRLWDGQTLWRHAAPQGHAAPASLEDYALVAQGLWDWGKQLGEAGAAYRALAARLTRIAWERYFVDGRWLSTDTALIPMLGGQIAVADGALPSASAVISRLSREHPDLQADQTVQASLQGHLDTVARTLGEEIFWYASYVELLDKNQR